MTRTGLDKRWIERMKSLPESCMGYQKVKVLLKDGTVIDGTVHNAEILETNTVFNISNQDIADISLG